LERLGVSASVLWSAFTGFATVGAVAFFAAWSVLSNLFCALLIFTVGPFRVGDHIEVLDTAEKPGALGRVVDINLLYTTLEDATASAPGTLIQIPNSLIFQRVVRRWRMGTPVPTERLHPCDAPPAPYAAAEPTPAPKAASFP
jgi:small-conductance mechanosensitive channel